MEDKIKRKENPWNNSNFFNNIFFCWITPFIIKYRKNNLEFSDIYNHPHVLSAENLGDRLQKEWKKELQKISVNKKPNFLKACLRFVMLDYFPYIVLNFFEEFGLRIFQPLILGHLLQHFSRLNELTKNELYIYASFMCLLSAIFIATHYQYMFGGRRIGMSLHIACSSIIYRKALRLNQSALGQTTVGQMVNLLSNDVGNLEKAMYHISYLISAPIQVIIISYLIWRKIGYATVAGLIILISFIPLQCFLGKLIKRFRYKASLLTDERIRLMREIIGGMRVIKMYCWEYPFSEIIQRVRAMESNQILNICKVLCVNMSFYLIGTKFILLPACAVYVIMIGGDLTPDKLFVVMSLYNVVRFSVIHFFTDTVSNSAEALVSIQRIEKFLLLDEQEDRRGSNSRFRPRLADCGVHFNSVSASWEKDSEPIIRNISMAVSPGDLLVIAGRVGSGKTSILMSILGEIPYTSGSLQIRGKISYAAQEPWIFSGSVKENVVFGQAFNEMKYKSVLQACALQKDIEEFPDGDLTLVGERGISLSGGQKARVSLARALYIDADVFLLDDPLSAVDAKVSTHLFEKCINGFLKSKVRILVTHQMQYLKKATKILLLNQNGSFVLGTYNELMQSGMHLELSYVNQDENKRQRNLSSKSDSKPTFLEVDNDLDLCYYSTNSINSTFTVTNEKVEKLRKEVQEQKARGAISKNVYKTYLNAGSSYFLQLMFLVIMIMLQFSSNGSDFWLSKWTHYEQQSYYIKSCILSANKSSKRFGYSNLSTNIEDLNLLNANDVNQLSTASDIKSLTDTKHLNISLSKKFNINNTCIHYSEISALDLDDSIEEDKSKNYLLICVLLIVVTYILGSIRTFVFFYITITTSKTMHNNMFNNILKSPASFFERNPVGAILNRFSKDVAIVDFVMPQCVLHVLGIFFHIAGSMISVTILQPLMFIPSAILLTMLFYIRKVYIPTTRDVKRFEGISRSPIFSHLSTSLYGLTTIRACGVQQNFEENFDHYQNEHSSAWFMELALRRWLSVHVDSISVIFLICTVICVIIFGDSPEYTSQSGLALMLVLQISGSLQYGINMLTEAETQMTSVERILEYSNLELELSLESQEDKKPPTDWPSVGGIQFENVSLKYGPEEPYVLKNLNFDIYPKEKIGIVGRTGAGKTSIITCLFRMTEPEGNIFIDALNTKEIGLHDLRKKISIIPQDPVLFTASIRRNLDPFNEYTDDELWKALDESYLKELIQAMSGGLDSAVIEGGANFSVGQRQLLCLARALLRRNKFLVLDEATANVDPKTDSLIQRTIRERFADCTVLTIAHRLHTIMDSDRILVLDSGEVKEFDDPYTLLQIRNSLFSQMTQMTGRSMVHQLRALAKEAFLAKTDIKISDNAQLEENSDNDDHQMRISNWVDTTDVYKTEIQEDIERTYL